MKAVFKILLITNFIHTSNAQEISFELLLNTVNKNIVEITHAGDERLFALNKNGTIEIISPNGEMNSQPFLDITHLIESCSFCEHGLLGLAFHPNYSENGLFFIYYTDEQYNRILARYVVSENPDLANPEGTVILTIPASSNLHFGGKLAFEKMDIYGFLLGLETYFMLRI